jgi:hypothetical protein
MGDFTRLNLMFTRAAFDPNSSYIEFDLNPGSQGHGTGQRGGIRLGHREQYVLRAAPAGVGRFRRTSSCRIYEVTIRERTDTLRGGDE